MKLYTYYRSSASYRVRIALNLKGLTAEHIPVNLLKGDNLGEAYRAVNPQGLLPALEVEEEAALLTQSLAITEYLEERFPTPELLPSRAKDRARVRALAQAIACEVTPLNNRRVLLFLTDTLGLGEDVKLQWIHHWLKLGFDAVEALLQDGRAGKFCHGDAPTLADCVLVPQVYNAHRFGFDMGAYHTVNRIVAACEALPAFAKAHPDQQADAPKA
ncbi:MAG: maleylacetoacetate isomerase [Alphaproteobacteria bacterium]|nr:maleylacetoacetate isomerase [Alphaproteobacteria bacterium]